MKTLVVSVIIAMTAIVNVVANNRADNFAYNTEVNNERIESQTVFKVKDQKYLHNHLKYNYIYDNAGRIVQKEVLKWNDATQSFEKNHSLNFFYTNNESTSIEYAVWNPKENAYSDVKAKSVYQAQDGNLRYLSYEWSQKDKSWNLTTEHNANYWSDALLAVNGDTGK